MCECKTNNDSVVDMVDPEMEPIYKSGLHWAIFSFLIITFIDALIGIYASGIAFYNWITKPPQEYLRWGLIRLVDWMQQSKIRWISVLIPFEEYSLDRLAGPLDPWAMAPVE